MMGTLTRQQLELVSHIFLFQGVDEFVAEQMAEDQRCWQTAYEKGETVFDEAHFSRCLGVLLSGRLRVEKHGLDGRRLNMSHLEPGECFGAAAMFCARDWYAAVITAEKPAQVLFLPQELIVWAMRREPRITENYISYLSERIWFLNGKISALTAGTAEKKLAAYLLAEGDAAVSMTELSRKLNISRASLYRAAEALEERDLIRRQGKGMEVPSRETLRAWVKGEI